MSRLQNGDAELNLYTQRDQSLCDCDSRRNRDHSSVGIQISPCQGGNCGEERVLTAPISVRDTAEDMDGNMKPDAKSKNARQKKEMTLEDMYNNQYDFDDEDDDSDWEPVQKPAAVIKWFCVNCTMFNLGDDIHCDICGEHKESGILKHGFFASPFLKEADVTQNELEVKERYEDPCSQISESGKFTAVGFDERMLLHSEVEMKSHPHPERPDRLRAIIASLATAGIFPGRCFPISAREITEEELHMVHSLEHIQSVELTSQLLASYFTPDTYANEHSAHAARLAAGLCADLASEILSGNARNGFALVRPPGHHAGIRQAMGFCLHNNAAVAALAALGAGAKRVLIVDWDVHHGNGTQEIFDGSKTVLYISLHRHEGGKFYPGTGAAHEVGSMGAEGYCVNVPWSRGGVGDNDYLFAFQHVVLPIASEFSPDFIIISAGFDAARGDPLGGCDVTPSGFAQMTHAFNALSGGKLLVILEGGYNLRSISSSATAVIKVLLGESPGCERRNVVPSKSGMRTVLEVLKIQMKFWPTLEPVFSKLQSQWGTYALPNRKVSSTAASLRKRADPDHLAALLAIPDRDAPTLGYCPSYKGVLTRRKKKSADEERTPEKQAEKSKRKRRQRASGWFGGEEQRIPGFDISLQTIDPDMSRRGVKRKSILDDKPVVPPPRDIPAASSTHQERRPKPQFVAPSATKSTKTGTVLPSTTEAATGSASQRVPTRQDIEASSVGERFSPSFVYGDAWVLSLEDSVKAEPDLATTMLYGLALLKDMDQLPKELVSSFKDMCSHLVQAGQAALNTSSKLQQVYAERQRYHDEAKSERLKAKKAEKLLAEEKEKYQKAMSEVYELRCQAEGLRQKMKDLEDAEAEKLAATDKKAYQEGMDKAAEHYTRDARRWVNQHLSQRLGPAWTDGFKAGVVAYASKFQADAPEDQIQALVPIELPEFPLPFTAEQTAPLPFDDEEEGGDEAGSWK